MNAAPRRAAVLGISLFGDPAGATIVAGGVLIVVGSIVTVLGEKAPGGATEPAVRTP